jgi:hypothetical protein
MLDAQSTFTPILNDEDKPGGAISVLQQINNDCEAASREGSSGWIDQHATLISKEMYESWISGVKLRFPKLWATFASLRGINYKVNHNKDLIPGKERQVLHQIMTTTGQRNPHHLKWWSMINSFGLMSWSICRTAFDCLTYWGAMSVLELATGCLARSLTKSRKRLC